MLEDPNKTPKSWTSAIESHVQTDSKVKEYFIDLQTWQSQRYDIKNLMKDGKKESDKKERVKREKGNHKKEENKIILDFCMIPSNTSP